MQDRYNIGFNVVPDDNGNILADALWIGGAGNVSVEMREGGSVTFNAVPAGKLIKASVRRVNNTGTTATLIVGLR